MKAPLYFVVDFSPSFKIGKFLGIFANKTTLIVHIDISAVFEFRTNFKKS
jgi:hypothetical protein